MSVKHIILDQQYFSITLCGPLSNLLLKWSKIKRVKQLACFTVTVAFTSRTLDILRLNIFSAYHRLFLLMSLTVTFMTATNTLYLLWLDSVCTQSWFLFLVLVFHRVFTKLDLNQFTELRDF